MKQASINTELCTSKTVQQSGVASRVERQVSRESRRAAASRQMAGGIHPDSMLPIEPHVTTLTNLSKATVYRRARTDPTFPKLHRFSSRCTRMRAGDLLDWLKSQGRA